MRNFVVLQACVTWDPLHLLSAEGPAILTVVVNIPFNPSYLPQSETGLEYVHKYYRFLENVCCNLTVVMWKWEPSKWESIVSEYQCRKVLNFHRCRGGVFFFFWFSKLLSLTNLYQHLETICIRPLKYCDANQVKVTWNTELAGKVSFLPLSG